MSKIQVIIPTITKDYLRMRDLVVRRVTEHLPAKELIFIGNSELCDTVSADIEKTFGDLPVRTIHEEELLKRQPVIDVITDRVRKLDEDLLPRLRGGWYYQQFLKMAFYEICDGDYYMSWDMDTVPLVDIPVFDEDSRPVFDLKSEYNPGYFKTIENLLGLKKNVEGSFVSEHMIFKKDYMKELIGTIEAAPIEGNAYWEKILMAVDELHITLGFSEFETYGTFVSRKHAGKYSHRQFRSFRRGSWFTKESELNEDDIAWLAKDYHAVTFENAEPIPDMVALFRNEKYRKNMSARKFYETILESGYFGEYKDGRLIAGDWFAPV